MRDFEGLGSVLMQVAHGLAEAFYSRRTLIWGPRASHPAMLGNHSCSGRGARGAAEEAYGYDCYFEPLSRCTWRHHVFREEARRFDTQPHADSERVSLQTVTRGALAMYAVPPRLEALLPAGTRRDAAAAAECWAGALAARAFRLSPGMASEVDARARRLLGTSRWRAADHRFHMGGGSGGVPTMALSAAHLRHGDVELLADVYTNREVATPRKLARALQGIWAPHAAAARGSGGRPPLVYLATDATDARGAAASLRRVLDGTEAQAGNAAKPGKTGRAATGAGRSGAGSQDSVEVVVAEDVFRTPHGSHAAAFSKAALDGHIELPLPYEYLERHVDDARQQEAVRRDAIFDIYMLSAAGAGLVGAASSTFAVSARLAGVGHGRAAALAAGGASWTDVAGVASGELATGYMRGMRNGTNRLLDGAERHRVALARALGRPLRSADPPLTFDSASAVPLVHVPLVRAAAIATWRGGGGEAGSEPTEMQAEVQGETEWCSVCDLARAPTAEGDGACDAVELVNRGAELHDGALMNWHGAQACWRRALMAPGRTRHAAFSTAAAAAEVAGIARDNLGVLLGKHERDYGPHIAASHSAQPVRGGGGQGGGSCAGDDGAEATRGGAAPLRLHVEGWRGVPHSYAVAAAGWLEELAARCMLDLSWADAPMPRGFAGAAARVPPPLPARVRLLPFGTAPQNATVLRFSWPYNLSAPIGGWPGQRAIVFATAEHLACPDGPASDSPPFSDLPPSVSLLTPSQWSAAGLVTCGVPRRALVWCPMASAVRCSGRSAPAMRRRNARRSGGRAGGRAVRVPSRRRCDTEQECSHPRARLRRGRTRLAIGWWRRRRRRRRAPTRTEPLAGAQRTRRTL